MGQWPHQMACVESSRGPGAVRKVATPRPTEQHAADVRRQGVSEQGPTGSGGQKEVIDVTRTMLEHPFSSLDREVRKAASGSDVHHCYFLAPSALEQEDEEVRMVFDNLLSHMPNSVLGMTLDGWLYTDRCVCHTNTVKRGAHKRFHWDLRGVVFYGLSFLREVRDRANAEYEGAHHAVEIRGGFNVASTQSAAVLRTPGNSLNVVSLAIMRNAIVGGRASA